ncbi:hypothetical protein SAY86_025576 [Trapa natans]|uniref:Uncharacterized protein n=1 Tax=Trapa natans TaxID=22666 RepID=A0AAN7MSH5_TRANT|nr:hypothetical protein SAY86_025576 [Trapa natans]
MRDSGLHKECPWPRRTDCCVMHGGGKRCNYAGGGSTDFCKAHGGGKSCTWPEGKCEKFARWKSGLCAAHSRMAQEEEIDPAGLIGPRQRGLRRRGNSFLHSREKPEEGSSSSIINGYDAMIILDERVHGGGLMSLLGGNLKKPIDGI